VARQLLDLGEIFHYFAKAMVRVIEDCKYAKSHSILVWSYLYPSGRQWQTRSNP